MVVHFTQGGNGAAIKTSGTTETHAIQTILQFADGDKTDQYKCASDGSILFYIKSKPAGEISFNFSADGCHHFLHLTQKTPVATKMSNEAVDFLIALANQSK